MLLVKGALQLKLVEGPVTVNPLPPVKSCAEPTPAKLVPFNCTVISLGLMPFVEITLKTNLLVFWN